ncbi:hypothetical protein ACFWSB_19825, partial [Streptomyces albidoflavus]
DQPGPSLRGLLRCPVTGHPPSGPGPGDVGHRAARAVAKRSAVFSLRDRRRIDGVVLLRVQEQLDAEEVRLAQVTNPV